jgi:hypothetical protein
MDLMMEDYAHPISYEKCLNKILNGILKMKGVIFIESNVARFYKFWSC